jgi:hypothetical protein
MTAARIGRSSFVGLVVGVIGILTLGVPGLLLSQACWGLVGTALIISALGILPRPTIDSGVLRRLISVGLPTIGNGLLQLGADVVRANLYWRSVSPAPRANANPRGFTVADPSSPRYRWAMYDHFVANARAAGLRVYLTITEPTPDWGSREPRRCREGCIWKPDSQPVRQVREGGRPALPRAGALLVDLERAQPPRLASAAVQAPPPGAVFGADVPLALVSRLPGDSAL